MAEKIENRQEKITDKKDSNQQEKSFCPTVEKTLH
jgi:hypothetical protein